MKELNEALQLSMSQEFTLRRAEMDLKGQDEKVRAIILDLMKMCLVKDNVIKHLLKKQGI